MGLTFRAAEACEAAVLTDIAFAAKRHWQYREEWIELWADELTVDAAYVENNWVLAAADDARILGWCAVAVARDEASIDYCWVRPDAAGQGIGRALVQRALEHAAGAGFQRVQVIADPNAEGFYRRLGFQLIGDVSSRPAGRRLPLLQVNTANRA